MKKLIGNADFYKKVLLVAVPIMIQNGITNFVSLLDNIMVGQVGTEQMSGVAIINQLMFVFNIGIFGAVSGAGIFGAQFYGSGNQDGVRHTFRFKWIASILITVLGIVVFTFGGENLIRTYLQGEGEVSQMEAALHYGRQYLAVMMIEMIPFAISQIYAGTLRECGETILPMKAGMAAVLVNLVLNYILIFGKFGAPALGVVGAALATTVARFVETGIVVTWTHRNHVKHPFIKGAYRSFRMPGRLAKDIMIKGMPLLLNETLWSAGTATLLQCYSVRGLEVVAGMNICSTISNVFNIVFISMGGAISIIIGQLLGAGKMEEARDTDTKLIFFTVTSCVVVGIGLIFLAPLFPEMYNTTEGVKMLATRFIQITALCMPLHAFMNAAYFTLRSGGKTIVTFLFDSGFMWLVTIPVAYVLSRYTTLPIVPLYLAVLLSEIFKCILGFILVKKGVWLHNIVAV